MNLINLELYDKAIAKYDSDKFDMYLLDANKFEKEKIKEAIFDIASEKFEDQESDISDEVKKDKELMSPPSSDESEDEHDMGDDASLATPSSSPSKRKGLNFQQMASVGQVIGLVLYAILQKMNKDMKKEIDELDDHDFVEITDNAREMYEDIYGDNSEISNEEMAKSAFGQGSNTAKILSKRAQEKSGEIEK